MKVLLMREYTYNKSNNSTQSNACNDSNADKSSSELKCQETSVERCIEADLVDIVASYGSPI